MPSLVPKTRYNLCTPRTACTPCVAHSTSRLSSESPIRVLAACSGGLAQCQAPRGARTCFKAKSAELWLFSHPRKRGAGDTATGQHTLHRPVEESCLLAPTPQARILWANLGPCALQGLRVRKPLSPEQGALMEPLGEFRGSWLQGTQVPERPTGWFLPGACLRGRAGTCEAESHGHSLSCQTWPSCRLHQHTEALGRGWSWPPQGHHAGSCLTFCIRAEDG